MYHRAESFELVWNTRENLNLSLRKGQDLPSVPFRVCQYGTDMEFEYVFGLLSSISPSFEERNQSLGADGEGDGEGTRVNNAKGRGAICLGKPSHPFHRFSQSAISSLGKAIKAEVWKGEFPMKV